MTRDEAIIIFRKHINCILRDCPVERKCSECELYVTKEEMLEAEVLAVEVIDKRVPLEPKVAVIGFNDSDEHEFIYYCPDCNHWLSTLGGMENTCSMCGRTIDWTGIEPKKF